MNLKRFFLRKLPLYIALIYGGLCLYIFVIQESLIFFPVKGNYTARPIPGVENVEYTVEGVTLRGWLLNRPLAGDKLVVYYGGNAEEVYYNIEDFLTHLKAAVLLVNYRGYGESEGRPSEKALFGDALAILAKARETYRPKKLILMGRSLGSGVASYAASRVENSGVVLVTPFDSMVEIARHHYPLYPAALLLRHRFESTKYVPKITSPVLVLYGTNDFIVPNERTENLLKFFKTGVTKVLIKGVDHNDIAGYSEYWDALAKFIDRL